MRRGLIAVLAAPVPLLAQAQHSPYGGEERREIQALSADEVNQYLAGAGMGYARAAELNRFPGPMHVLKMTLNDSIALVDTQLPKRANADLDGGAKEQTCQCESHDEVASRTACAQ